MKQTMILKRGVPALRALGALLWLYCLRGSMSYWEPYLAVALGAIFCLLRGRSPLDRWQRGWVLAGSGVFSFAVTLANYSLFSSVPEALVCFALGAVTAEAIFAGLITAGAPALRPGTLRPGAIFAVTLALVSAVDLLILWNCYYPGILTYDSVWQVEQFHTGLYSNHHPFYHTQLIRAIYSLGMALTGDPNFSVALYCSFQILVMGAVFGYVLMTLYQRGVSLAWVGLALLWYGFMPVHVMFSFSVWKDVLWSGMVAVFLTALYRRFTGLDRRCGILLALSGLVFCLMRSNGWLAFAASGLVFACFFWKQYPKLWVLFLGIAVLSWWMKGPALDSMGILQPDAIESLSIPAQQVARVVDEGLPLTPWQSQLIDQVAALEQIPDMYVPHTSDHIKELVRRTGDQTLLVTRRGDYVKLWLELGLKYPWTYVQAWVEETKGYWNGGYDYWIWEEFVYSNDLGLRMHVRRPGLLALWQGWLKCFTGTGLRLFVSIGFHVWAAAAAFFVGIARKRWKAAFLMVPLLAIIATLMVATPVFAEFRYAYGIFTCMPLILLSVFDPKTEGSV